MELVKIKENLYVPVNFGKDHYYFADAEGKKKYTGITSVLGVLAKPALIGWAAKMAVQSMESINWEQAAEFPEYRNSKLEEARTAHTRKKEEAGAHGTDAHALVEQYINSCIESFGGRPVAPAEEDSIKKFTDWAVENVDHFLFAERRMAHPELFLAGTADFAYVGKDGKKYMGDFKTSSGIYGIDYWLQVAAYRLLAEGEGDEPYDGSAIVRLGKDGSFEAQYRFDWETDKEAFLACLTLYRAQGTYVKTKK